MAATKPCVVGVLTLGTGIPTEPGLKDRHSDRISPGRIVHQTGFRRGSSHLCSEGAQTFQPRVLTLGTGIPTKPGLKDRHSDRISPRRIVHQTGFRRGSSHLCSEGAQTFQPGVLTLGTGMPTEPGLKDRHSDRISPRRIVHQTGFRVCVGTLDTPLERSWCDGVFLGLRCTRQRTVWPTR